MSRVARAIAVPVDTRLPRAVRPAREAGCRAIAALEFAFVAPMLLTLMLIIMEVGLVLFGQAALDAAAADASRLIRTGQVQLAANGRQMFTTRLCGDLSSVVACGNVQMNVQAGASFGALTTAVSVNSAGAMQGAGFAPGGPGQFVVVQVGYQPGLGIPLVGPILRAAFGSLLLSTVVFQNEPY